MKHTGKTLFNLIEIFRTPQRRVVQTVIANDHCEQNHHHDFYCDTERPFVQNR
ncbi:MULTISPECIES: hypothetical protein [Flagellimonas]|jgi:hypothetical protein|uniref:hypothetical protein n=1 Tax=Flagellimonas TaxID=444459 RepID=UPI000E3715CD|nr:MULTISPECIES: hypothetical protein [Allomuricauda]MCR9263721.1 hypothetical protein [Flavobacteriaceae bacterium]